MPRRVKTRVKPSQAKEVIRLRKKQERGELGTLEKRKLKRLAKKVDGGLVGIVKDIRKEDP